MYDIDIYLYDAYPFSCVFSVSAILFHLKEASQSALYLSLYLILQFNQTLQMRDEFYELLNLK